MVWARCSCRGLRSAGIERPSVTNAGPLQTTKGPDGINILHRRRAGVRFSRRGSSLSRCFAVFDLQPRLFVWVGLFWGVTLLARGFRLCREAGSWSILGSLSGSATPRGTADIRELPPRFIRAIRRHLLRITAGCVYAQALNSRTCHPTTIASRNGPTSTPKSARAPACGVR